MVYDAAIPPDDPSSEARFLAYWIDMATESFNVFGRQLFTESDVGDALLSAGREFQVDVASLTEGAAPDRRMLRSAVAGASGHGIDTTPWHRATWATVLELMGFDPLNVAGAEGQPSAETLADQGCICVPLPAATAAPLHGPPPGTAPDRLVEMTFAAGGYSCVGVDCSDGDACTIDRCVCCDECLHDPRSCNDNDPCTDDLCDPATGCQFPPKCSAGEICCPDGSCGVRCCGGHACNGTCCGGVCCNQDGPCCGDTQCCASGQYCCDPDTNLCCNETDTCCGNACCSSTEQCCDASLSLCCPTDQVCCGEACCADGEICCNSALSLCCPEERCCGDLCCEEGKECCNPYLGLCCSEDAVCCGDRCCPPGGECCGEGCCLSGEYCAEPLEPLCCDDSQSYCGVDCCDGPCCETTGECCPVGGSCCNDECCSGRCCTDDAGISTCCGAQQYCCHGTCCSIRCCNGVCCEGLCCPDGGGGEQCCPADWSCCGNVGCCPTERCCGDFCCGQSCEECIDDGMLSGGIITVEPDVVCLDETITFTIDGVVDSGGLKRVECTATQEVPPVLPTYTWELTIPPDYPPPLPPLSGSGPIVSVVAKVHGTYSVDFTASADRECPPDDVTLSASKDTCAAGTVAAGQGPTCGITMTLKAITFQQDHTMYANADPGGWGAGPELLPPDWQDENSADNAICYTRSSALEMDVLVEVENDRVETPTLRVTGPDGVQGTVPVTTGCGTMQQTVTIVTTPLPDYVYRYEPMTLNWSYQRQGETTWTPVTSTAHHLFVSYGTPTYPGAGGPDPGGPTQWRMRSLCGAALLAGTDLEVIDGVVPGGWGIHAWLAGDPPLDGRADPNATNPQERQVNDWSLMAGVVDNVAYFGECHHQAHLMNLAIQLLGAGAGTEYKTHASTDAQVTSIQTTTAQALGVTQDLDGDGVAGEADEKLDLIFDFDPDPLSPRKWNLFEGSISAAGRYYSVWPSFEADSEFELFCNIVQGIGAAQRWVYRVVYPDGTWYVTYAHPGAVEAPCSP